MTGQAVLSPAGLERVTHQFPPVFDKNSRVLVLGTMPSPKSTAIPETGSGRFWQPFSENPVPKP